VKKFFGPFFLILTCYSTYLCHDQSKDNWKLRVSSNGKFLQHEDGTPFFWLADTGWLLFKKLNREEVEKYLEDRGQKGFNVIQIMIIHGTPAVNVYGDSAFVNNNPAQPKTNKEENLKKNYKLDFWNYLDLILDIAASKQIYLALVPAWGSNIKSGFINNRNAVAYADFLAKRYKNKPNIIWLNGGDIKGNENSDVWNQIGKTLKQNDPNHLITFHPFGRMQSSQWFHNEAWLDFNMFQSGHKRYNQDPTGFGEDNWKYVEADLKKKPTKPVVDGEPSYENIPQGLHDSSEVRWKDYDVRRYAYWSVFAGAFGHTYGNNSVMQFHKPEDGKGAYGATDYWYDAITSPGAQQLIYLRNLILSRPYFNRVPDKSILADSIGTKYDYLAATRGKNYLFVYSYNCRKYKINLRKINGDSLIAHWYNPRNGETFFIGKFLNKGTAEFTPPCKSGNENDWVLVIDDASKRFSLPGRLVSIR
jgi:hypothetical protein